MSMPITEAVLDYQPDKLQVLQMKDTLSGHARWQLSPEDDGTRLTTTFDYALPGGVFGKLADALIAERMNATSLEQGLDNLKALPERKQVFFVLGATGFRNVRPLRRRAFCETYGPGSRLTRVLASA